MTYQISIIIPVYNQESYLKECLDSVANQTIGVDNIEVLLINDKSTDDSLSILEQYSRKYSSFKIISHETNMGLGEAKNTGMANVSSDYVMFLDSDDYLDLNIVEDSLKKIKSEDCQLLIFNWQRFPEDEYSIHKPDISKNEVIESISQKPNLVFATSNCAKVFHKSLYRFLNFPAKLYEDNIASLESLFNADRIFLSDEVGYFYRKTEQSLTDRIKIKNALDLSEVVGNLFELIQKHPDIAKYIKPLIIRFSDDILFWLNHYDWHYLEELEIVEGLQKAFAGRITEEDIDFYYSIAALKVLNPEDILNLGDYDSETFLAKYKYLLKSAKVNPVASLYIDTGNGFNEDEKISIQYNFRDINNLTFDLSEFDNIKLMRFDPCEDDFISCKILKTNPITNRIDANCHNSLLDEYQTFYTLDPSYVIEGDFKNVKSLNIQFELNILNNKQLSEILQTKNQEQVIENDEPKGFLKKLWG